MVRVLLVTHCIDSGKSYDSGGSLCVKNHIGEISRIQNFSLSVASIVFKPLKNKWLESNKIDTRYFLFEHNRSTSSTAKMVGFPFESYVDVNSDTSKKLCNWCKEFDIIIVEHIFAALFIQPVFNTGKPIITVTHNREYSMYSDHIDFGLVKLKKPLDYISIERLKFFEQDVYRNSRFVVALSKPDLPSSGNGVVLTPILDKKRRRWKISDSNNICFVGMKEHYPNFYAMKWISEIADSTPDIIYSIFGAGKEEVDTSWQKPNIFWMGSSDAKTVEDSICSSMCSIAPISNDYGFKFKIGEAFSYGCPVLLSEQANKCVEHISTKFVLKLHDMNHSSNVINSLLDEKNLVSLCKDQLLQNSRFYQSNKNQWEKLLGEV